MGAKTAQKLIQQFGSVETLLARSSEIKGKMREKIETNADNARLSYELATIRRDVPLSVSIDDCERREFDKTALRELLHKLEFRKTEFEKTTTRKIKRFLVK